MTCAGWPPPSSCPRRTGWPWAATDGPLSPPPEARDAPSPPRRSAPSPLHRLVRPPRAAHERHLHQQAAVCPAEL
nr:MAG TPA: hypothetical protein [Caudoviricetes sp.]